MIVYSYCTYRVVDDGYEVFDFHEVEIPLTEAVIVVDTNGNAWYKDD